MIEPLSQQHALEIANDWHYEAPYDFYDMKNDPEGTLDILLANQNEENFALDPDVEKQSMDILLPSAWSRKESEIWSLVWA